MFDLKDDGTYFVDLKLVKKIRDAQSHQGGDMCIVSFYGKKNEDIYVMQPAATVVRRLGEHTQFRHKALAQSTHD